jgi:hypothetical protein
MRIEWHRDDLGTFSGGPLKQMSAPTHDLHHESNWHRALETDGWEHMCQTLGEVARALQPANNKCENIAGLTARQFCFRAVELLREVIGIASVGLTGCGALCIAVQAAPADM